MRLAVLVVAMELSGNKRIYSRVQTDRYDPDLVEELIHQAISEAVVSIGGSSDIDLQHIQPQIEVLPVTGDLRPSFHLSPSVLQRIASAGASFDFDPYA